jgi:hypothetical protein
MAFASELIEKPPQHGRDEQHRVPDKMHCGQRADTERHAEQELGAAGRFLLFP